jgi:ATP-binding cassette subfamily B protein
MDCGPTCLKMICKFYGKKINTETIRKYSGFNKEGVSLLGLSDAGEKIGFITKGFLIDFEDLNSKITFPAILHWGQNHFVIIKNIRYSNNYFRKEKNEQIIEIVDPAIGLIVLKKNVFLDKWISSKDVQNNKLGVVLTLEPTNSFFSLKNDNVKLSNWNLILKHIYGEKSKIIKILFALIVSSIIQFTFPFLTQYLVDKGINKNNLSFVTIILFAQLMLMFSKSIVDFIKARILLKLSNIVNISLFSDFWQKLVKLPFSHFETIHTGDTLQRINDNKEIQNFLTGSSINTIFSFFSFLIFSIIMVRYDLKLFIIFLLGSCLYFIWINVFFKIKRDINYLNFHLFTKENNATLQLVRGMHEIRMNSAEKAKTKEWINIQIEISKLNFKSLSIAQIQQSGALFISQSKDIIITFIVSKYVIEGKLSFGTLLAIQYIIGQLENPIEQFVVFMQSSQNAKISLERLNEIYQIKNEEDNSVNYLNSLPNNRDIIFNNLSFKYPGSGNTLVFNNLSLTIEYGKTTAIVGDSGSGKTTILKLLLKFYENYEGSINIGDENLKNISSSYWRKQCSAVLQDGYIFNDSIMNNIAIGGNVDIDLLNNAALKANILNYIVSLPNSFETILGDEGYGLSQGQKQRLLIARAIYKNPNFIFFDEATNSLDSNNEKVIIENLNDFFNGKTVVIVAHRLSTVKNADKIFVMKGGLIVEEGSHIDLLKREGHYFELVKNQIV